MSDIANATNQNQLVILQHSPQILRSQMNSFVIFGYFSRFSHCNYAEWAALSMVTWSIWLHILTGGCFGFTKQFCLPVIGGKKISPKSRSLFFNFQIKRSRDHCMGFFFHSFKARSHDPIWRIRILVPKIGGRCSYGMISSFQFCLRLLSFKKSVGWKLSMFHFHLFPQNYESVISVLEGHFYCVQKIQFLEPTKVGSCEQASTETNSASGRIYFILFLEELWQIRL